MSIKRGSSTEPRAIPALRGGERRRNQERRLGRVPSEVKEKPNRLVSQKLNEVSVQMRIAVIHKMWEMWQCLSPVSVDRTVTACFIHTGPCFRNQHPDLLPLTSNKGHVCTGKSCIHSTSRIHLDQAHIPSDTKYKVLAVYYNAGRLF